MNDGMVKFNNKMLAEQSVYNFIEHMEKEENVEIPEKDKEWLLKKGAELFDTYYVDDQIKVMLATQEDKDDLEDYFNQVQQCLGHMFAHIILLEYKLHLIFD